MVSGAVVAGSACSSNFWTVFEGPLSIPQTLTKHFLLGQDCAVHLGDGHTVHKDNLQLPVELVVQWALQYTVTAAESPREGHMERVSEEASRGDVVQPGPEA